jgi:hypothetical protein
MKRLCRKRTSCSPNTCAGKTKRMADEMALHELRAVRLAHLGEKGGVAGF